VKEEENWIGSKVIQTSLVIPAMKNATAITITRGMAYLK